MTQMEQFLNQVRPIGVRSGLDLLKRYRLPLRLGEALLYLRNLKDSTNLLLLYRHFFPEEYFSSTASTLPEKGQLYSPKEQEFFALVDENLFPLPLDYYQDSAAYYGDERSNQIEVMCLGIDWWNGDLDELEFGWKLLLALLGEVEAEALVAIGDAGMEAQQLNSERTRGHPRLLRLVSAIAEARPGGGGYTGEQLARLEVECQTRPEPVASLPLALRMLMHATANLWLDPVPETPVDDACWGIEDVELLTEAYREASHITERVEKLIGWLEADFQHFEEVIQLWNRSCQF